MRYIWRVKPKGKRDLEYALRNCNNGDTILLAAGRYHFPNGVILQNVHKHNIEIKGDSENPEDVVIHSRFNINKAVTLTLSHLTIQALHESNAVNVKDNSVLNLNRVMVNGRSEEHTSELQSRFDLVCRLLLE